MADLSDYGIEFDDDGRIVGFQVGKAAALLDWKHRKEAEHFQRVVASLYKQRHYRQNRELYLEKDRSWKADFVSRFGLDALRLLWRIYAARHHQKSRELGRCLECNQKPVPGRVKCELHRRAACEREKKRRLSALRQGLCAICKKRPCAPYAQRCNECRAARKAARQEAA